jgi:outer membrane lipoprotein carrier protein
MRMRDSLSQLSILSFDDINLNESIDAAAFRLDYPDSVDVIRDGA